MRNLPARKGVEHVLTAHNGDVISLGPESPCHLDQIQHGKLYRDGDVILSEKDNCFRERHRLAAAGIISIAFALNGKGDVVGTPDVTMFGLPEKTRDNRAMDEVVDRALFQTLDGLPRAKKETPTPPARRSSGRCAPRSQAPGARNHMFMYWL